MPQIIVRADDGADPTQGKVLLRERISASDFESHRFATNLLERLGWAVNDAAEVERDGGSADPVQTTRPQASRKFVEVEA